MMSRAQLKIDMTTITFLMALLASISATVPNVKADTGGNPSSGSVNIVNNVNESVVAHCQSKESDLGPSSLSPNGTYYWEFHPNVFGHTVFYCDFLWRAKKQEFDVWKGSYFDDRPLCSSKGLCSYKICADGFYNAVMVDSDTDSGPSESWEFVHPWLPNPPRGKVTVSGTQKEANVWYP